MPVVARVSKHPAKLDLTSGPALRVTARKSRLCCPPSVGQHNLNVNFRPVREASSVFALSRSAACLPAKSVALSTWVTADSRAAESAVA